MNVHTTEHVADHTLPLALDSPQSASSRTRSRTGCYTCRRRNVKCDDEEWPVCANCRRGNRACEWGRSPRRKTRAPRRPNATACYPCTEKKLRCVEAGNDICERCGVKGIRCIRADAPISNRDPPAAASPSSPHFPYSHTSGSETGHDSPLPSIPSVGGTGGFPFVASESLRPEPLSPPPTGRELDNLVQLYFSSVHQFGFFAFIHQLHFNRLLAKGIQGITRKAFR
ncbi:hypothetical protein GGR51DRAFT_497355 [Nemania sp. FL0031]|nr:hypothetical protein GGR51DRAFT_497355 [Nemania sp. FL0031]